MEIVIDLINQTVQDFRVKYQESGIENLAYLQSIENKCKIMFQVISVHDMLFFQFTVKSIEIGLFENL